MKVNVSTAVNKKKNRFDISTRHITTLGVNDARVTNIIECVKGDKIVVDVNQFSRLSPLVAPTYGSFKLHTYAFYVPFTSIWHHFYEYLDNSSDSSFTGIKEPLNVSLYDLLDIFVNWSSGTLPQTNSMMTWTASAPASTSYDFTMSRTASGTTTLYAGMFTAKGRLLWNNLQALGYSLPTYLDISGDSSSANWQMINSPRYSLFPILALARVFYDYLYPAAYVTQGGFGILFTDSLWELYNSNSDTKFRDIFDYITRLFVNCYDRDFFTSLWSKPNQVASTGNLSTFSALSQHINTVSGNYSMYVSSDVDTSSPSTPNDVSIRQSANNVQTTLSAQTLRWLESISDYCMRNNIGGSRVREYLRSHYGFVSSDENSDISKFLKSFSSDVNISDVSNLAAGELGGVLGEQAGRGQSAGSGTLKFECNDFGYLIFITSVVPQIGYYQGQKPLTRSVASRFDFYTPEFDGVGMEAVPRSSIFSSWRDSSDWSKVSPQSIDDVFGFAPMYAERYKKGQDYLTGDFLFNSRNKNLDSYHTFRDVLYNRSNLALDAQFLETDNQTQRIFAYTGETEGQGVGYAAYDKIFSFFRFDVTRYSNMKSLYQSLPMFDRSGKDVSVQYEGGQL